MLSVKDFARAGVLSIKHIEKKLSLSLWQDEQSIFSSISKRFFSLQKHLLLFCYLQSLKTVTGDLFSCKQKRKGVS